MLTMKIEADVDEIILLENEAGAGVPTGSRTSCNQGRRRQISPVNGWSSTIHHLFDLVRVRRSGFELCW